MSPFLAFLIISAVLFLIVGFMLIFFPQRVKKISDFLNLNVLDIDKKMKISNKASGALFIIIGLLLICIVKMKV